MNTHARRLLTLILTLASLAAVVVVGSGTAGAISSAGESPGNPGGTTNKSLVSGGAVIQAAQVPSSGALKVLKGGYRAAGVNSGDGYADPLAGAVLQHDTTAVFAAPTAFAATDALGAATAASVVGGTHYVREQTAPAGWTSLPNLTWNGSTSPYVGTANVNGGTTTATVDGLGRFINAAANPPLPTTCGTGLKVLLLLDTSGSTSGYNDAYRTAAKTFVSTLGGTPTTLKISTFASSSSPGSTVYDLSGAAGQTAANSRIDAIYPNNTSGSGSTNWDAAMQDAASAGVDVIVFVTDGNPTVNQGDLSTGGNTSIEDVAYGVGSANLAKYPTKDQAGAHQRVLGVGVGADLSTANLAAMSGPVDGTDYTTASNPDDLAAVLKQVASKLCSGTVTVNKIVVPSTDTGTFTMLTDGTAVGAPIGNGGTTGPQTVSVASHTFAEAAAPGTLLTDYTSAYSCSDPTGVLKSGAGTSVTLAIAADQKVTCTFTNTLSQPQLKLIKTVVNDNGGTATAADFSLSAKAATGSTARDFTSKTTTPGFHPVFGGTVYNLAEVGVTGYAAGAWVCEGGTRSGSTISVPQHTSVTCSITNDDVAPKLHLRKVVTNDNGGSATVADFTLKADGAGANDLSGTSPVDSGSGLKADTFALSEASAAGYSSSAWVCTGGSQSGASITLGLAGEATCTITNTDVAPLLTLVKTVANDNGGTATAADFTLSAKAHTGSAVRDFSSKTATPTAHAIFGGVVYDLSETGPAGYAAGTWNCDGGAQSGASISLLVGKNVTCTIANRDVAPQLTVIKHVINDNGGTLAASDFTLGVKATNPVPASFVGAESPGTSVSLDAGAYVVSETTVAGYAVSYSAACTGTIAVGDTAPVCTVTNNDIAPVLNLRKTVVNSHGGKAVVTDFTLGAAGTVKGNDLTGTSPVDSGAGLQADTWTLSESSQAGYAASAWVCDGGTQKESQITLGIGEKATCAIMNSDVAPQLTVVKHVINDNGGTLFAKDFTIDASGTNASPTTFPGDETGTKVTLDAGAYKVSETPAAGYAVTYSGDCSGTIAVGDKTPVCTVTNDDIAPTLIVIKHVINDNGGTLGAADFTLDVTGPAATPDSFPGAESPGTTVTLNAGAYSVGEGAVAGYAATYSGDCSGTIAVGDTAPVCTVTNNDIAPILRLNKTVINNNGGTALPGQFTLIATGTDGNNVSGPAPVTSGEGLKADTFVLSESGPAGYAAGAWSCDTTTPQLPGFVQDGSSLTLGLGEDVTCTIVNNDIAPILHLRKVVVNDNGGTATVADFTLTATGTAGNSVSGVSPVDSGAGLLADTWTLSEAGPAGYTASAWTCVGGTQLGTTVSVAVGGEATCTITNNDNPVIAPPVIAPPVAPVVAPPVAVRGTARISGPQGCILGGRAVTRVSGRNIDHVVFIRDGRVVKRTNATGTGLQAFALTTVLQANQVGMHTVVARVYFKSGTTPRTKTLTHRFALCRVSPVTG